MKRFSTRDRTSFATSAGDWIWEQGLGRHWRTSASVFLYDMTDFITPLRDAEGNYTFANLDAVRSRGAEFEVEGRWAHGLSTRLSYTNADVQELETAIREQDAARLRLVAHRVKGSAANVSAEGVRECASRLEVLGREENLVPASDLLAQLRARMEAVKDPTL